MDDKEFSQLLQYLGLSWQGYRKVRKGVKKRIGRHMQSLGCRSMREYLAELERNAEIRNQCDLAMTVPISRFFRDQILWECLRSRILPGWTAAGVSRVRAWSAGCARGEEVYSLKILWEQISRSTALLPVLELTASDLNPHHLEKAVAGVYSSSSLREVPEATMSEWFEKESSGRRFRVKPALRAGIVWLRHDLFSGPPGSGFDLILARNNLLTYYHSSRTRAALEAIAEALSVGGYLIIGSHEKLPDHPPLLHPVPCLSYVFRKTA